jgi:hypothetical protein
MAEKSLAEQFARPIYGAVPTDLTADLRWHRAQLAWLESLGTPSQGAAAGRTESLAYHRHRIADLIIQLEVEVAQ